MNTALALPDVAGLEKKTSAVVDTANGLKVADDASFVRAGEGLKIIKSLQAEVENKFKDVVAAAHDAHKKALKMKNDYLQPLIEAESILKTKIRVYSVEQERKRQEEIRRQQEEQRKVEEARRKAEEEVRQAEEERKRQEEENLQLAIMAEEEGNKELAEELLNTPLPEVKIPEPIPVQEFKPVVLTAPPPKVAGVSLRMKIKWECVNLSIVPDRFLKHVLNESLIDEIVKIKKLDTDIPGIKVYEEPIVASGRC